MFHMHSTALHRCGPFLHVSPCLCVGHMVKKTGGWISRDADKNVDLNRDPRNYVLDGGLDLPREGALLDRHTGTCPLVDILKGTWQGAACGNAALCQRYCCNLFHLLFWVSDFHVTEQSVCAVDEEPVDFWGNLLNDDSSCTLFEAFLWDVGICDILGR